ncbi:UDP-N-acetylglucosamine 2-epimerase (non-hydrolyzing) [Dactylosporangium sp. NPDC005555]|uniref:non-hydrolyzing UDP-N-acetylglucosamine 2-epimerase n=1 Tax=Dactylosporangium sp. NPDC005555 TaxID=3154889 RepID=UPI0033B78D0F
MTKVLTIVGTRPEVIRLSRVIDRLDHAVEHVLVHTGQNRDYQLNGVFFDELGLRRPDRELGIRTDSIGVMLADVLVGTEAALLAERPDAVLILGDTNSSIAAVIARRMHIPVYHMEAGNRCFDLNVPEETNRRLVDHVSDFNLVYTEHARRNLLAEGLHPRRVHLTGSPMREVLTHYRDRVEASTVVDRLGLTPGRYFVVSAHRAENVDDPRRLTDLIASLDAVRRTWGLPLLVSTHPRTRARLAGRADADLDDVTFHEPFGFFDYIRLQRSALCTLSDSGTVSEESAILGFPAVTLRDSIERPEALEAGSITATGLDPAGVVEAVRSATTGAGPAACPPDYLIDDTSHRVLRIILSTVRRHHDWAGIRRPAPRRHAPELETAGRRR